MGISIRRCLTPTRLIVLAAVFLVFTGNFAFFGKVTEVYPWHSSNLGFLLSMVLGYACVLTLVMSLLSCILPVRLVVSFFFLLAAIVGYFADQFGTVVDTVMIQNVLETYTEEATDLMNTGFLLRLLLLGMLPVLFIWRLPMTCSVRSREYRYKAQTIAGSVALVLLCFFGFGDSYTNFFRTHKPLRYYANPAYALYSMGHFMFASANAASAAELAPILPDVRIESGQTDHELIIMVVGEAARTDRFSLNGYSRQTNPELFDENGVVSYSQISACGTSTAVSLPCMFAIQGHDDFDRHAAKNTENVLDVLNRKGVSVLWRDNNAGSKGIASRVPFEDFSRPEVNPVCDIECRDPGMLDGLQEYIDAQDGDILIVLHQMGNHGPAYFKRYPAEFERFTPACHFEELSRCTDEEIGNAYDNAILYTDYFLSRVIALLQINTAHHETAMLYVSDHGESLGEKGLYLHGLPYLLAPKEQTSVPVILWVGDSSDIDINSAQALKDQAGSHDSIFYSLLSAFEIDVQLPLDYKPLFYVKHERSKS